MALKIAINLQLVVQMTAFSEGVLLAEKSGISRENAVEVMLASVIASPMVAYRGPFVLEQPDEAWFDVNMMQKDMNLALELGRELDVPLPTTAVTNELLTAARGMGLAHKDFAVVFDVLAADGRDREGQGVASVAAPDTATVGSIGGLEPARALSMYRQMTRIRLFEEQVNELYRGAKMPGLAHLYIGEEAVAVGVCEALRRDDYITSTHRGHGHCLAKGADVDRMFAELLGKEAGYCRGKGGSMHIADHANGNLGANAIVGGSTGIATGAAFSAKRRGTDQVAVCFFGEGALGQGCSTR